MYEIEYTENARKEISLLRHNEPKAFNKVTQLLLELMEHPKTGTGHPELLKSGNSITWSRRITKKHRLVYEIHEKQVLVLVLAAYGHYNDK